MSSTVDRVVTTVTDHGPADVLLWTGAGVPMDSPTSLPTGWELTDRLFSQLFVPWTLDTVLRHHRSIGWLSNAFVDGRLQLRLPRLETVLGVVETVLGTRAFDVLDDMRAPRPNGIHDTLADHLAAGGRQIIANFDGCIEETLGQRHRPRGGPVAIHHFHGSLADDPSGAQLGATLRAIETGLDDTATAAVVDLLESAGACVILGYSGSDFFDIDPLVAQQVPGRKLDGLQVLWVAHGPAALTHVTSPAGNPPPLIDHLRRAGAQVDIVAGPTTELVGLLAAHWGFAPPRWPAARAVRTVKVPSTADERITATFRLFRALGLQVEIEQMLDGKLPALVSDEERWAAQPSLLWESGRWSSLRRQWRRRPPSVERDERIGACLWTEDRFLPAYLWLELHRRRCPSWSKRQVFAETAGRVVEHMSRVPDLRWLGRRLAGRAAATLETPSSVDGLETWRRRLDLLSSLQAIADGSPRPVDDATTTSRWFEESGNLSGALSYRHRALRDACASTAASSVNPADYLEQLGRAYALGTRAGAWRVVGLPGSEQMLRPREAVASTIVLEYGWWHRVRVLVDYIRRRPTVRLRVPVLGPRSATRRWVP